MADKNSADAIQRQKKKHKRDNGPSLDDQAGLHHEASPLPVTVFKRVIHDGKDNTLAMNILLYYILGITVLQLCVRQAHALIPRSNEDNPLYSLLPVAPSVLVSNNVVCQGRSPISPLITQSR